MLRSHLNKGLISTRTIDGITASFEYLRNGLETKTQSGTDAFTSEYLPSGALNRLTLPNGVVIEHEYDLADRMTSKRAKHPDTSVLSSWTEITYDADGNRIREAATQAKPDATTEAGTGEYRYDPAGRLIVSKHPFEADHVPYVLDDAGNVISETGWIYTYRQNRLVHKAGDPDSSRRATYSYDQRGNRQGEADRTGEAETTWSFSYDASDHTTRINRGDVVEYGYDGLDRQVRRRETKGASPGPTTLFFRGGFSEQIALEAEGTETKGRYILDSQGEPLAQVEGGVGKFYVTDPRGNLTQLLSMDVSGVDKGVKSVFAYDAYGKDKAAKTKVTQGWDSRLRFQMAPRDPMTGHHAIGPRLLDPLTYRFIGVDSVVDAYMGLDLQIDPLTGNRYLYAGANPTNMIDDGHAPYDIRSLHRSCKRVRARRVNHSGVGRFARWSWGSACRNFLEESGLLAYHQAVEDFGEATVTGRGQVRAGATVFDSGLQVFLMVRPAPRELPGFKGLRITKSKTPVQGGGGLRRRWKDKKGNIYEWDYKKGTVEKYNKRGKHQGEYDPNTGGQISGANKTRSVEP